MSEPFPSKAYRELCTQPEVADRLREEWEPKFGDWAISETGLMGIVMEYRPKANWGKGYVLVAPELMFMEEEGEPYRFAKEDPIPLFQPRQLIEMLEKRGRRILGLSETYREEGKEWWVVTQDESGDVVDGEGPDPATALLRAYLSLRDSEEEVTNEEEK